MEEINDQFERLKSYFEPLPVGIVVLDVKGSLLYVNHRGIELYGQRPAPGLEMPLHSLEMKIMLPDGKLCPPEYLPASRAVRGEEVHAQELIIERPDGSRVSVSCSAVPLKDEFGNIFGSVGTFEDITALTRREEIYRHEDSFRALALATFEGVLLSEKGVLLEANEQLARMLGYPLRELIGKSFREFILPEDCAKLGNAMMMNEPLVGEYRIRRKDGSICHVEARGRVFEIRGKKLRVSALRDITALKLKEQLDRALAEIDRIIHSTLDFDTIMQDVVREAAGAVGCESVAISLRNGDRWVPRYFHGFPGGDRMIGKEMDDTEEPHALLAVMTKKPVVIADAFNDYRVNREHMREWNVRSVMVVPLTRDDDIFGVIFFNNHFAQFDFLPAHVEFGARLASSVSLALANAELFGRVRQELGERRRAEEMLQRVNAELERRVGEQTREIFKTYEIFNLVMGSTCDMIASVDTRMRLTSINKSAKEGIRKVFGEDLKTGDDLSGISPGKQPQVYEQLVRMAQKALQGEAFPAEIEVKMPEGSDWYEFTFSPVRGPGGEIEGAVAIGRDVSARRKAEQTLREANVLLEQRVAERTAELKDSVGRFELVSTIGKELLKTNRPEEAIRTVCASVMERLRCRVFFCFMLDERAGKLRLSSHAGITDEEAHLMKEIELGAGNCSAAVSRELERLGIKAYACYHLTGPNGRIIGALSFGMSERDAFSKDDMAMMQAAADQVSAGMNRLKYEESLAESERKWRELAEFMPLLVFTCSSDGRCDYLNRQWADYTGIPSQQQLGFAWLQQVHPEDRGKLMQAWAEAVRDRRPFEREFRIRGADESYAWFICRSMPIKDAEGAVVKWLGFNINIQEFKLSEDMLKRDKEVFEKLVKEKTGDLIEAKQELERTRRLSDIGTLATTVAHELRNPLAAIHMAAINIGRKTDDLALYGHLSTIQKKVLESDQIISNLLFYSRLKEPHFASISLREILSESVANSRSRSGSRRIDYRMEIDAVKKTVINADPVQLREVFNNILNNAVDAIPKETRGIISVTAETGEGFISIGIRDNGIGIDEDTKKKIFEPFFTTKSRGTGLGLSVCWQIVKLHKGQIKVESSPGEGALVTVRLPVPAPQKRK